MEENERKLFEDTGIRRRRLTHDEVLDENANYRRLTEQSKDRDAEVAAEMRDKEIVAQSESKRLDEAIAMLGLTKTDLLNNFPALVDNYDRICERYISLGRSMKTETERDDAMFVMQFNAILSLLECDEDLAKKIISEWPQEYGNAVEHHRLLRKS